MNDILYAILHKGYGKILGVSIENSQNLELDIDTGNIWIAANKEAAQRVIEDPAAWFESSMKYPKHSFKPEDLVVLELSNSTFSNGNSSSFIEGYVTNMELNQDTVRQFPEANLKIMIDKMHEPQKILSSGSKVVVSLKDVAKI